ncbi:MAG: response regulator [Pseudomonadota bacterium]
MNSLRPQQPSSSRTPTNDISLLVVEDDRDEVYLIKSALKALRLSIRIDACRNGQEGLAFLEDAAASSSRGLPNIILLDLKMPVLDGRGFLEQVKAASAFSTIPIVVLTGEEDPRTIGDLYRLGASSVVSKVGTATGMQRLIQTVAQYWFETSQIFYVDADETEGEVILKKRGPST